MTPDRLGRVAAVLALVTAIGVLLLGATWLVVDLSATDDAWHGLGIFIGLLAMAVATPPLLAALTAWRRLRRRPDAPLGLPMGLTIAAAVWLLMVGVMTMGSAPPLFPLLVLPVAALGTSVAALAAQRRTDQRRTPSGVAT